MPAVLANNDLHGRITAGDRLRPYGSSPFHRKRVQISLRENGGVRSSVSLNVDRGDRVRIACSCRSDSECPHVRSRVLAIGPQLLSGRQQESMIVQRLPAPAGPKCRQLVKSVPLRWRRSCADVCFVSTATELLRRRDPPLRGFHVENAGQKGTYRSTCASGTGGTD